MEDRNEIGNSAIKRLNRLETIVLKFNLTTIGGAVQGGFGELKPAVNHEDRMTNLENAVDQFALQSRDVNVAGNFDDGFIFS